VCLDDLCGQIAVRLVPPKCVDVDRLHVDAALVHLLDAVPPEGPAAGARESCQRPVLDHIRDLGEVGVRVDVHHLYAPRTHADLPPRHRRAGLRSLRRGICEGAASNQDSSGAPCQPLEELPSISHLVLLCGAS